MYENMNGHEPGYTLLLPVLFGSQQIFNKRSKDSFPNV